MTPEERIIVLETKLERLLALETRVAKLERAVYIACGALAALQFILKYAH